MSITPLANGCDTKRAFELNICGSPKPQIFNWTKKELTNDEIGKIAFKLFDIMIEKGYVFKKE